MASAASAYRFDELGWVEFERLCDELLAAYGLPRNVWTGRADRGRVGVAEAGLTVGPESLALAGPAVAITLWSPRRRDSSAVTEVLPGLLREEVGPDAGSAVVLTNRAVDPPGHASADVVTLGPRELGELVDATPVARRRSPSVLGVRDLGGLVDSMLVERSTGDVAAAHALAAVFVPTYAYLGTLDVLERHRFAVVTGPPEMGKTAIARTIGLALLTEGWELHECLRPDDLWSRFDRSRPQLFIADDAFGSTEYRPEAAERWALELDRVLQAMDDRHWLVWTSRPAPLKAALRRIHREHGVERFPQPAHVQVDASELDLEEKTLMLFRHAKAAGLGPRATDLVKAHGWDIVSHRHFTPERIRRFVGDRLPDVLRERRPERLAGAIAAELREPTTAMASSLRALPPEYNALLVALVDAPPGPVAERDLAAAARRHSDEGLPRPPGELVERLTDHFVRVVPPTSVTWVHPSWRDLVIEEIAAQPESRRRFLERASLDGLLLALSVGGGSSGERSFPFLADDADWDALADRLALIAPELDDLDLHRLLASLSASIEAAPDARAAREGHAVASAVLTVVRMRWDASASAIPVTLLEAWLGLARRVPEELIMPELGRTWHALEPSSRVDVRSGEELNRLDEWLRLAQVFADPSGELPRQLGSPGDKAAILAAVVDDAQHLADMGDVGEAPSLLLSCLRRIEAFLPGLSRAIRNAAIRIDRRERAADETSALPRREAPRIERSIVARILGDL